MRLSSFAFGVGALILSSAAWADDCAEPYSSDTLLGDLVDVEAHLLAEEAGGAKAVATKMQAGLGCLNETLPTILIGRVYRSIAGGIFLGGDQARGKQWMMTAIEVDGSYTYGVEDLGPNHVVRLAFDQLKASTQGDVVAVDGGKAFIEGKFLLDGRKLSSPSARVERPHLLQHDAEAVRSWLIEGNAFPADVLVDAPLDEAALAAAAAAASGKKVKPPKEPKVKAAKEPKPEKVPKEKAPKKEKKAKGTTDSNGVIQIQRARPPEQIPLIIGGAALVVTGGVLYGLSHVANNNFKDANTVEDAEKYRKQANAYFISGMSVGAAGLGTLTYGIVISGEGVIPTVHFRW